MKNNGNHKRFPIFCELSNDRTPLSRGIQVATNRTELLAHELSQYGQVPTLNSRSVTVLFRTTEEAVMAQQALSRSYRVAFSSESTQHEELKAFAPCTRGAPLSEEKKKKLRKKPIDPAERESYVVDLRAILSGSDRRTTIMIKNIPNKYTQTMLLQTIDKHLAGQYNFFYLPIDFKVKATQNKCNVGYAFVNVLDAAAILALYRAFHNNKWECFNSDKIAQLAYARIQGQRGLIRHFEASSVMNHENALVKPIIKLL